MIMKRYKKLEILFLNQHEVRELLTVESAIERVELAFKMHAKKQVQMPSKIYLFYPKFKGDLRAMPAYIEPMNASGVKIVNVHLDNKKKNLPTVMAVFVLVSPETGAPLAIMDAGYITDLRTGAAGAVASRILARKDSRILGLVGAGQQAKLQLLAISKVMHVSLVKVCAKTKDEATSFVREMQKKVDVEMIVSDIKNVCDADIISTTTPVRTPIVMNDWIKEGTHINAIGADAPGKQELDVRILQRARIFVDDLEQATHSGEVNVGLSKGELKMENICGELGEVLTGKKTGRMSNEDITIFDSTGLAIQDVALADLVYKRAKRTGAGRKLILF